MDFTDRCLVIRGGGRAVDEQGEKFLEEEEKQKVGKTVVVSQPNGRWGAQIYEKHQGIWLGTYDSEQEPARSYDRTAISIRNGEAVPNFKSSDSLVNTMPETHTAGDVDSGEREHMFDKVVTPSDVGKLNRLVIPKQHAEKYFPIDSSSNEKGLLLNFEDSSGKPWRFRYSYWNSSQSYVMTKGWSRFVKEKKLDAGDIVSFERGIGQVGKDRRLYIGWKRRQEIPEFPRPGGTCGPFFWPSSSARSTPHRLHEMQQQQNYNYCNQNYYGYSKNKVVLRPQQLLDPRSIFYLAPQQVGGGIAVHGGERMVSLPTVFDSVPVVHEKAATKKRLRLFGVNLDCPAAMEDEVGDRHRDGDGLSSATAQQPKWLSHTTSPSHLQLRLYNGTGSQLSLPTVPDELPSKARLSRSLDLEL